MEKGSTVDFNVLPEGCISNILSLTSPGDACRSSLVSSIFRWASESDIVWEKFLPFSEVAELINVCWLEIHGKMENRILSPKTTYAAYLVFKFSDDTIYGLGFHPAEVSIRFIQGGDEGGGETRAVYLAPDGSQRRQYRIVPRSIGRISRSISHRLRLPASTSREREGQRPKERVF
ncbi:hypothetical protein HHK36_020366 [Tetracentron sinense]|uniref:F-box domain-containing protein n=1 Tax=Tetracentron sinense TaxID=13715 RepID=A0A834YTX5_TETSI|nr:hypothetical protein HHK36_020366 [Tetracentron sinense]